MPGLVVAELMPDLHVTLLDGSARRAGWLLEAVDRCNLQGRVEVIASRAEQAGRSPDRRGRFAIVLARSFAAPPVTAECAAPFLRDQGLLVVSEPPRADPRRWPVEALSQVGLVPGPPIALPSGHYQTLTMSGVCPERFPRRVGVPTKRPLYIPTTSG